MQLLDSLSTKKRPNIVRVESNRMWVAYLDYMEIKYMIPDIMSLPRETMLFIRRNL